MTNIILSGCNGKMGQVIVKAVKERTDCQIICGVDIYDGIQNDFPVYPSFDKIKETGDVIIDFSNPASLSGLLDYAVVNTTPCVLCTTGYFENQIEEIKTAAEHIAVFKSGNMSLGINLIIELSKKAAAVLGSDFDIEIIEKHHNQKLDAPSGTAIMIADGISTMLEQEPQYVYDRHSYRRKRSPNEIGIHAVRGGTIVGEHEVLFAGRDETLSITHTAQSKEVFATGAVNAAVYMNGKEKGMYDMSDLLQSVM